MIRSTIVRVLSFGLGLCLLAGVVPSAAVAAASNTRTLAPRGPAVSDAQIEATIRTKLAKSKIGKDGFRFKVSHGTVTWEGKTDVIQHKGSATRMAHTAGATQVVNNIQISDAAKSKAAANLKKGEAAGGVKRAAVS